MVIGITLAAITACSDPSPTGTAGTLELTVSSDRSVYSLATDSGAEPILVNRGSVRVYLPMNEYVFVQRFEAGAWSEPRPWFVVDGIGISFSLEPGGDSGGPPPRSGVGGRGTDPRCRGTGERAHERGETGVR